MIEGHTDNVPISAKLKGRFKSNWELSTTRATTVVRYLIDQGSVDRQHLSAVGYADTQPHASNDTEEGRSANRRIEIVLYPKDLNEIAGQTKDQRDHAVERRTATHRRRGQYNLRLRPSLDRTHILHALTNRVEQPSSFDR